MPGGKKRFVEVPPSPESVTNPEERYLEYLERSDRLRRVLMNRRAKTTKDTNESGPESATQDASNREDEPNKSTNEQSSN